MNQPLVRMRRVIIARLFRGEDGLFFPKVNFFYHSLEAENKATPKTNDVSQFYEALKVQVHRQAGRLLPLCQPAI